MLRYLISCFIHCCFSLLCCLFYTDRGYLQAPVAVSSCFADLYLPTYVIKLHNTLYSDAESLGGLMLFHYISCFGNRVTSLKQISQSSSVN